MKILVFLINILCLKFCVSIFNISNNDLQLIVDVIKSYDKPTAIVAKVCWKTPTMKIKLAKMLSDVERPNNIRYLRENEILENSNPNNHLLFLIDINCDGIKIFFSQASANKMFSKTYRWLVIGKPIRYYNYVPSVFENLNISVDSEVIMAQERENKDIVLNAIYKIKPNSEWNIEYYGTWSADKGLNKSENRSLSNVQRRKDFRGESLTTSIVIFDNKTKSDLLGLGNLFVDPVSKMTFHGIIAVHEFLNASRQLIFSDSWGYLINNTWNGMIGDLYRKKADLIGTVSLMSKERMQVLEYLVHPSPVAPKIVFRQPPLSYQNNLFLLPFTTGVWFCTGAFVLLLIFVLYINTKWDITKHEKYNKQKMDASCLPPTWGDITIFVFSAISQQGSSNELKGTLGRLVMFLIFLAFVFLYTSYSASIVALLQSTSNNINTLSDFLNSKLELGLEDAAYSRYYFSAAYTSRDPLRKAIYETKVAPGGSKPNFMSMEEGIKKMQTEPFAFNMNIGTGYKFVTALFQEHEKCGLKEINFIQDSRAWFCCQKYSPYSEMFKVGYIRLQEHGLNDRANRLIYAKKPVCSVMGGSFGSVNMVDFYPVLLMLMYGMIFAFVLLVLEIFVHRRQEMKRVVLNV